MGLSCVQGFVPRPARSDELQRALDAFNKSRWGAPPATDDVADDDERSAVEKRNRELRYVETERARVSDRAAEAPDHPHAFVAWFEELQTTGPGQRDPLFDWLENEASLDETIWVLRQESATEAGFDDHVARTREKVRARVTLEGVLEAPVLSRLADELGIGPAASDLVPECHALANLLAALAAHRRYAYASLGALVAGELTSASRAAKLNAGLRRLGMKGEARREHLLRATLDEQRTARWNRAVLRPLVASDPRTARSIAEGALMRLDAGARCVERYRRDLGMTS
jgi:hypothetical protein